MLGASWLAINMPLAVSASQTAVKNKEAGADFENLSPEEAVELSAIVDQIIPADDTPGASETGVVYFIDVALGSFMNDAAPKLREGLEELQQKTLSAYPESTGSLNCLLNSKPKCSSQSRTLPCLTCCTS